MGAVSESIDEMLNTLMACHGDAHKFDKGNDVAGTRVRKALKEVKDKAHGTRMLVIAERRQKRKIKRMKAAEAKGRAKTINL